MLDIEIRNQLSKLLAGEMTLSDFQLWFTSVTWDVEKSAEESPMELIGKIELALAEHSAGHLPWEDFREEMLSLLRNYTIHMPQLVSAFFIVKSTSAVANTFTQFLNVSPSTVPWSSIVQPAGH